MPWNPDHYNNISWKTGTAAERFRAKKKSEPPADKKIINKLHDSWATAHGYRPASIKHTQAIDKQARKVYSRRIKDNES